MADDWTTWAGVARVRQDCEAAALAEGLSGLPLFFRGQELFQERLRMKPSYRARQQAWRSRQSSKSNPMVDALRAIAEGHNDPRRLAREVLDMIESE